MIKTTLLKKWVILSIILVASSSNWLVGQNYNYPEVLQKSMFFYEAQRAGKMPADNRITWRGDAALTDGADVGLDLTGGWFDAGDHAKFNFPMAYSVTTLCWGYLENKEAFTTYGQKKYFLDNIKWATDYFIKCHSAPNILWGQCAAGGEDHKYWVPAEVVDIRYKRESFKIDAQNPGTDLACETAAAMAAASMVFADEDPAYSAELLKHAKQLFNFGDKYRGVYSDVVGDVSNFYRSWSGYRDELAWGAIWLYLATEDNAFLNKAKTFYKDLNNEQFTSFKSYGWTLAWDDKGYGCYVLMAQITGEAQYLQDAERHLDQWFVESASDGKGPKFTGVGFPILDQWGSFRYAANSAFLLQELSDLQTNAAKKAKYYNRAKWIIDYLLGDNPQKMSYVIGFGKKYPMYPHHRTAHGSWARSETEPKETRHILYGALVGGHKQADDFDWVDSRHDYVWNEVACDYNSLFNGAVARLAKDFGGKIEANFPKAETPNGEFVNEARINSTHNTFTEVAVWTNNRSGWPARIPNLSFRYFVDLSEGFALGYDVNDYQITLRGGTSKHSRLIAWDEENHIYYVEVTFDPKKVTIYPGGQGECKEEAQLRIGLEPTAPSAAWDPSNDWSFKGLGNKLEITKYIPIYGDGSEQLSGLEAPGGDQPKAEITATPVSGFAPLKVKFDGSKSSDPNGDPLTYTWNFGDGTSAKGKVVNHTYTKIGKFTATLTVNDGSYDDDASVVITVQDPDQPPVAVADADPKEGFFPLVVAFDGTQSSDPDGDALSYEWTLGNAVLSTDAKFSYTFNEPGDFNVSLAVVANGKSSTDDVVIKVYDNRVPPTVEITNPLDNETYAFDTTILVSAKADDYDGTVVKVEFSVNGTVVNTDTKAPYEFTYIADTKGDVTIAAVATDNDDLTASSEVSIKVVKPLDCDFGTPLATALPSTYYRPYKNIHVLGDGGPDLSNVSDFTMNWDLPNKGLWQFSMLTTDGKPNWWNDFLPKTTHNFDKPSPDITLSGTGFPGLDGDYWVALHEENFVMVSKSGGFTIYFSNSSAAPSCGGAAARAMKSNFASNEISKEAPVVYPMPFTNEIFVNQTNGAPIRSIELFNSIGAKVSSIVITDDNLETFRVPINEPGNLFIIKFNMDNHSVSKVLIRK
ncbi:MAG: glycoside hydrolase family 9 protein [Bacteroidales bacterium]|nr:glycoside hydrolase family 9 protein [Bacteroidales bacterium]